MQDHNRRLDSPSRDDENSIQCTFQVLHQRALDGDETALKELLIRAQDTGEQWLCSKFPDSIQNARDAAAVAAEDFAMSLHTIKDASKVLAFLRACGENRMRDENRRIHGRTVTQLGDGDGHDSTADTPQDSEPKKAPRPTEATGSVDLDALDGKHHTQFVADIIDRVTLFSALDKLPQDEQWLLRAAFEESNNIAAIGRRLTSERGRSLTARAVKSQLAKAFKNLQRQVSGCDHAKASEGSPGQPR